MKDIGGLIEAYSLGYSLHHCCMRKGQPKRMRGLIVGYDWVNDLKNYQGKKSGDRRKAVAHKHRQGIALFITTDQDLFIPFFIAHVQEYLQVAPPLFLTNYMRPARKYRFTFSPL